jgi:microcystin-dependent protein
MTLISYTYELTPGQPEDIAQTMANFNTVKDIVNGKLGNDNLADNAAIAVSKLAPGTNGDYLQTTGGVAVWAALTNSMPPGVVLPYGGASAPTGFLLCDGAAVSRSTYAALFTAIGTAYGVGDGSTTFNVPDTRGRMPVGKGTNTDIDALGENEGESTVGNRRPKHKHTFDASNLPNMFYQGSSFDFGSTGSQFDTVTPTFTIGPQTNVPTDAPGYLVFNMIIKT